MTTIDPWADMPTGNGTYAKWTNVGDAVVGTVISRGVGTTLNGDPCPQIVVRGDDGEERTVTASQAQLRAKLMEARPNVGDRVAIKLTKVEPRTGGKTLKHFEVAVARGEAGSASPSAPSASDLL